MVWHIFKKDWKLLWVFVITVASLHWISAFIIFKLGLFGESAMLDRADAIFQALGTLDEPARIKTALAALDRGSLIPSMGGA